MSQTIIAVAALIFVTFMALAALRRLTARVRFALDVVFFTSISAYFAREGVFPIFPPLNGDFDFRALCLRVAAGAWWIFGARLTVALLGLAFRRDRRSRGARLFSDLSAAVIYSATALVVLNSVFALPVTGVVATSGVVAIVLGLALQNTLADVFAGIAVGIENPFRVGDRIRINDRQEGLVIQANWRSIRIQTDGDDIAVIPNSIVAKAEIVNRSSPSQRRAATVDLSCPRSALPERVIEILLNSALLCPKILTDPAASARLISIGFRRSSYQIAFYVGTTKELESTKDLLLRTARRHLHYAGLLEDVRSDEQVGFAGGDPSFLGRRLLRDAVLFESLKDEQLAELAGSLKSLRLEPGEALFSQGQIDNSLYLIAAGVVKLSRELPDEVDCLGYIGAGDYIGEVGLLTGAAHAATAEARTHCEAFQLSHDAVSALMEQNAELAAAFDKSARKGLAILHREVAAQAAPNLGGPGQLLSRIRSFLGRATDYLDRG